MTARHVPTHHLSCDLLLRYAAGRASPALHLFIASHLALCPACRAALQDYETQAGLTLETLPPEALETSCLENLLAKIDEHGPVACIDVTVPPEVVDARYPEPLRAYAGKRGEHITWHESDQGRRGALRDTPPSLYILESADARVPSFSKHTLLLVLEGVMHGRSTLYRAGDVLRAAALTPHNKQVLFLVVDLPKQDRLGLFETFASFLRAIKKV